MTRPLLGLVGLFADEGAMHRPPVVFVIGRHGDDSRR